MNETFVARLVDLTQGQCRAVRTGTRRIAVYNVGGRLHAIEDACGHMKAPLSTGRLVGTTLTCSWHGWRYDVTTGACLNSAHTCLRTFPVVVREGSIYVSDEPAGGADEHPCDDPDPIPTPIFKT